MPDVAQEVLLGAWKSIKAGRYRPFPALSPAEALRRWLYGIAWRLASPHRDRARVRRERAVGLLLVLWVEPIGPEGQIDARRDLAALFRVREPFRTALIERADGGLLKQVGNTSSRWREPRAPWTRAAHPSDPRRALAQGLEGVVTSALLPAEPFAPGDAIRVPCADGQCVDSRVRSAPILGRPKS